MSDGPEVGRVIPNALRQLPNRKRLFHPPPSWMGPGEVFFIKICCAARRANPLARAEIFPVIAAAIEHYTRNEKLRAHLIVAMPDHLHALISFPEQVRMEKVIRDFKRCTAKQAGTVRQDGCFDHRLRGGENFEEKARYARMNPVRAGLPSRPEDWPDPWPAGAAGETAR